jgi:uncharacterized protein YjhX (UPF0386 family)
LALGIHLHGAIVDFHSLADFKVRCVSIDATGAVIDTRSCASYGRFGNDVQVAVFGSLSATGTVKSTSVKRERVSDAGIVVTREGKVAKVDTAANIFAITTAKETLTVKWSTARIRRCRGREPGRPHAFNPRQVFFVMGRRTSPPPR